MAVPKIKLHIIPDLNTTGYTDNPDIATLTNQAKLIERAIDGSKVGSQVWEFPYLAEYMIKLKPISSGSKTYEIDIGPGSGFYHNTLDPDFYGLGSNPDRSSNISIGPSITLQKWLFNKREFGLGIPALMQFQVFALRSSEFIGVSGGGAPVIETPFTYIPRFGGYSFNLQEDGYPAGGTPYWGDHLAVKLAYDASQGRYDWTGNLNYTVDLTNMRITFSDYFYNTFIKETSPQTAPLDGWPIYIKTFIFRDNNTHSNSKSGILNSTYNDKVYYALPNHDLVETVNPAISYSGWTPSIDFPSPVLIKDIGIIQFDRNNYPVTGATVTVTNYQYHRWMRISDDFTDDLILRTYVKGLVDQIAVYNFANDSQGDRGHFDNLPQTQQLLVNFSWVDIKITNEILHNPSDPPNFLDLFIDAQPRAGSYRNSNTDNETISYGLAGLVDDNRPWDHQEGSRLETDSQTFIRATFDITKLINAPNGSGSQIWETNQMKQMNAAQAWRIRRWYKDAQNQNFKFKIATSDDIMSLTQSGSSVVLYGSSGPGPNTIYARIIYMLYNDEDGSIQVATGPKSWTLSIKGNFIATPS